MMLKINMTSYIQSFALGICLFHVLITILIKYFCQKNLCQELNDENI